MRAANRGGAELVQRIAKRMCRSPGDTQIGRVNSDPAEIFDIGLRPGVAGDPTIIVVAEVLAADIASGRADRARAGDEKMRKGPGHSPFPLSKRRRRSSRRRSHRSPTQFSHGWPKATHGARRASPFSLVVVARGEVVNGRCRGGEWGLTQIERRRKTLWGAEATPAVSKVVTSPSTVVVIESKGPSAVKRCTTLPKGVLRTRSAGSHDRCRCASF